MYIAYLLFLFIALLLPYFSMRIKIIIMIALTALTLLHGWAAGRASGL